MARPLRPLHFPRHIRTFDSFQYRQYRLLWAATGFSAGGNWLQQLVVGWLTYDLTKSAFLTSLTFGLGVLPILLAGLPGGLLVDAWDRRKLLAVMYLYQALLALGFSIVVILGSDGNSGHQTFQAASNPA